MDRSLRIPTDIIDRLLMGLDNTYRHNLSVGYPLPTDVDTNWAFPLFIHMQNVENFPVLGFQHQFTYYGATVYNVMLTSLANHTSLSFYLITPRTWLFSQCHHRLTSQRAMRIGKTRMRKEFHLFGLFRRNSHPSDRLYGPALARFAVAILAVAGRKGKTTRRTLT